MSERDVDFAPVDLEVASDRKSDLRSRYLELLDRYPLATKSITSATIGALGAMIAGASTEGPSGGRMKKKPGTQWLDVLAYAMCGAIQGPLGHYWYYWWEQHGPESKSNSMLVHQIVIQPPIILFLYMSLDVLKAGLGEVFPSMQRSLATLGPVVVSSWRFWPVALYLTGRVLKKRKNRVATLRFWSLLWAVYISKQRRSVQS